MLTIISIHIRKLSHPSLLERFYSLSKLLFKVFAEERVQKCKITWLNLEIYNNGIHKVSQLGADNNGRFCHIKHVTENENLTKRNNLGARLFFPEIIMVVNSVSSCLSFLMSASTAATYIFTALTWITVTIFSLESCALHVEF
jgi:hypothetical protein